MNCKRICCWPGVLLLLPLALLGSTVVNPGSKLSVENKQLQPADKNNLQQTNVSGIDVAGIIETVRHHIKPAGQNDDVLAVESRLYRAEFEADGFHLSLRKKISPQELAYKTTQWQKSLPHHDPDAHGQPNPNADTKSLPAEAIAFDKHADFSIEIQSIRVGDKSVSISPQPWLSEYNHALRKISQGITERVTARQGELEWDFILPERLPQQGDLYLEASIKGGTRLKKGIPSNTHLSWELANGRQMQMSELVVKDASGKEIYRDLPITSKDRLVLHIPSIVLASAEYPVTIDPIISPEYPVSEPVYTNTPPGSRYTPDVAFNRLAVGSEVFLVVWQDSRGAYAGTGSDIYGARVSEAGVLLDPAGIAISMAADNQHAPSVASNGYGFFVVWSDRRSTTDYDIYGARVNSTGSIVDGPPEAGGIPISTATDDQLTPDVAFNEGATQAGYMVVWHDDRSGVDTDIYGARVNNAGLVFHTSGLPISTAVNYQGEPAVESDGTDFLVVWTDIRSGADADIYGTKVSEFGVVAYPDGMAISTATENQTNPDVAAAQGGYYLIAWQDFRSGTSTDIYANRMGPLDILLDGTGLAISTAAGIQRAPAVAAREDPFASQKDFLILWEVGSSGSDIYGMRVSQVGVLLDGPASAGGIPVSTASGDLNKPSAIWGNSSYLITWEHSVRTRGMRMDAAGNLLDGPPESDGLDLTKAATTQTNPAISWDGTNYFIVWKEKPDLSSGTDIYGARVTPAGVILDAGGIAIATSSAYERTPVVSWDGANYLVVWTTGDIKAMRVSPAGALLDGPPDTGGIVLSSFPELDEIAPALAWNGSNHLVVWAEYERTCSGFPPTCVYSRENVYGRLVAPDGSFGFYIAIGDGALAEAAPTVASDGTNYVVAWERCPSGSAFLAPCSYADDIYAKRVRYDGVLLDGSPSSDGIAISTHGIGIAAPTVVWNGTNYLFAWQDRRNEGLGDIYGARLGADGVLLDGPPDSGGIAISTVPDQQYLPAIAWDGKQNIVVWEDVRRGEIYNHDVYGARVSTSGVLLDGPADSGGIPFADSPTTEGAPALIANNGLVAIAYQRMARENAYGTVERVFLRTARFEADLSISKTDLFDPIAAGANHEYTMIVSNNGPAEATGVTVTDTLPADTVFVSATPVQGTCNESEGIVTCDLGQLAAAASTSIKLIVSPTTVGTITNTVTVDANELDPAPANNQASETTTVIAGADIAVTKVDSMDPAVYGQPYTYTVTVTNNGPSDVSQVRVFDWGSSFLSIDSFSSSQGSCFDLIVLIECSLGALSSGASATVTLGVTPWTVGTVSNYVEVSSDVSDPDDTNNTATEDTEVYDPAWAEVAITKADDPEPLYVGDELTYTLTVNNNGPASATNVQVRDTLPAGVTYVSANASQGSCTPSLPDINCTLGSLAAAGSATVSIVVIPTTAGILSNYANVSADETDPLSANNSATEQTFVLTPSDSDGDGIYDHLDNCTEVANPPQRDTDGDNYGNYCDPDFDNSGVVNTVDLFYLKSKFFSNDPDADLNGDGVVNTLDLFILKNMFFGPPGPSCCAP